MCVPKKMLLHPVYTKRLSPGTNFGASTQAAAAAPVAFYASGVNDSGSSSMP